jgi:L-asparaginase II
MPPRRPGDDPENGSGRRVSAAKTPARKAFTQAHRRVDDEIVETADPVSPALLSDVLVVPAAERVARSQAAVPASPPAAVATPTPPPAPLPATAPSPVPGRSASRKNVRGARPASRPVDATATSAVLVRQIRGGVVESRHRGSVVEVGIDGSIRRLIGDPETIVNVRSAVKPFGLAALVEAGGVAEFDLSDAELAIMAGSHSGEDLHVRTLQGVFRRAGVTQQTLGCGSEGAPLDALTAARLARDGEKPGPVRHMCSGQHVSMLLLCRMNNWPFEEYWRPDHPVQRLYAATVARAFDTTPEMLIFSTDACGVPTYAFSLYEVARAFAMLADPAAVSATDARAGLAEALTRIRDAMVANPEMVGGTRERLDSSVMKAAPHRVLSKGGAEGLRGFALMPGDGHATASGVALKIEDGGGFDRAVSAASVEALRQVGALDAAALRALHRYHRPAALDPRGEPVAEAVAEFELVPVGERL